MTQLDAGELYPDHKNKTIKFLKTQNVSETNFDYLNASLSLPSAYSDISNSVNGQYQTLATLLRTQVEVQKHNFYNHQVKDTKIFGHTFINRY